MGGTQALGRQVWWGCLMQGFWEKSELSGEILCPPRRDILRRSWDSRIYCMSNAQNRWRPGHRPNHAGESHNAPRYPCIQSYSLRIAATGAFGAQPLGLRRLNLLSHYAASHYTSHLALEYWNQIDAPVCSHLNVAHIWHTASYTATKAIIQFHQAHQQLSLLLPQTTTETRLNGLAHRFINGDIQVNNHTFFISSVTDTVTVLWSSFKMV